MFNELDTVKLIFGLKVQQLRREQDLSYQQLSDRTGLALSYLHDIEKGKKYPKADKIMALAKALNTDYNYLVSLDGTKKLKPIIDLLNAEFLRIFPMERFGISQTKLIELLSHAPDKVNAFVSTVIKIIRNFQLQGEDFYKVALRSYQDMYDNYFPELEQAVRTFKERYCLQGSCSLSTGELERLLKLHFNIRVDRRSLLRKKELGAVRSFFSPEQKTLYLNSYLSSAQENFLLAKELGFQFLQIEDRPFETRMIETETFEKLLNNFYASYFSVALLMEEQEMVNDINQMAEWRRWDAEAFLRLLDKYDVTPEMLIQRMGNIFPRHFGVKDLFFLRFMAGSDLKKYEMTKELHLSQLHNPHANQLDEHYCRRWLSISLILRMKATEGFGNARKPIADAQISRYWQTPNAYLILAIAKPSWEDPHTSTSIAIGLLVNDGLKKLFRFLDDPELKAKEVHTTCERCSIPDCGARAAPPTALHLENTREKIKTALATLGKKVVQ